MEITISLDKADLIPVEQLQQMVYLYSIIFTISVDQFFEQKLLRIGNYVGLLIQYPTIKTSIRVSGIQNSKMKSYNVVAVGGTFDRLHIGHQMLLLYTVLTARHTVYIGVTGEILLVNKKDKEVLQSLQERMRGVQQYVKLLNPNINYVIFQLNDPYGPTINDTLQNIKIEKTIECLVTSPETSSAITKINAHRQSLELTPLQLVICPLLSNNSKIDGKISSSSLRKYFVDKNSMDQQELAKYRQYYINLATEMREWRKSETDNSKIIQKCWTQIFQHYSQYWRFYHTNRHIYDLLTKWKSEQYAKIRQQCSQKQKIILEISIFFHDIIYNPALKTNETESSKVAELFLKQFYGENLKEADLLQQVKQLILETQNHEPTSRISQILYDLDMGILNDPQNYKKYAQNIRKQFIPIYKENYTKGRIQFLKKTLNSKLRFSFEPKYLKQNMEWEIEYLSGSQL